jgi:ribonuclease P protein subunit RPR2
MKKQKRNSHVAEVQRLFIAAKDMYPKDAESAHTFLKHAFKIAQQNRIRFTTEQRREYCHNCYHYLYPGKNCEVRIDSDNKMLLHICKDCEHVNRFGYKN